MTLSKNPVERLGFLFYAKKKPTFVDSFLKYFVNYNYPFNASAPPTISKISFVIAA